MEEIKNIDNIKENEVNSKNKFSSFLVLIFATSLLGFLLKILGLSCDVYILIVFLAGGLYLQIKFLFPVYKKFKRSYITNIFTALVMPLILLAVFMNLLNESNLSFCTLF